MTPTEAFRAGLEAAAELFKQDIADAEAQIKVNDEYSARTGITDGSFSRPTPNELCRDQIMRAEDAIQRILALPDPPGLTAPVPAKPDDAAWVEAAMRAFFSDKDTDIHAPFRAAVLAADIARFGGDPLLRIAALEKECSELAADQCHYGYAGEHGHHMCEYQDRIAELEAQLAARAPAPSDEGRDEPTLEEQIAWHEHQATGGWHQSHSAMHRVTARALSAMLEPSEEMVERAAIAAFGVWRTHPGLSFEAAKVAWGKFMTTPELREPWLKVGRAALIAAHKARGEG